VTGGCGGCHDNVTATGKGPGHFVTNRECNVCHSVNAWDPLIFRHLSATYPGDHRAALQCADCHLGKAEAVPWPNPTYQPDCAACHANDYRNGVDRHTNLSVDRNCGSGGCHRVSDRDWD